MRAWCSAIPVVVLAFLTCGCDPVAPPAAIPMPENPATSPMAPPAATADDAEQPEPQADSLAIFEKRILPIFQSPKPSSCSECHLSGVDLKQYIRPTQVETFASLMAAGLIDVEQPGDSKLLEFIARKPEQASLVTDKIRQEELEAFSAWIRTAAGDPALLAARDRSAPIGPTVPVEVVRHARQDRVLASFIENVWTEVARCAACHSPDRNQKQVREHGSQVSWITLNDPQATLEYMLENDLIDPIHPEQSLIVQKPTLQVEHVGGKKMEVGDRAYKQFRRFLDDYAAVVAGKYQAAEDLPPESKEVSVVSEVWLKIEGVPSKYDKMLMQVDLYRSTDGGWSDFRVATSDRLVFGPKQLWQHSLSLTAPRGTPQAEAITAGKLPPGRYLAKIYIDQTGKLQDDFTTELDETDLVGQVEIDSRWQPGYGRMTVVPFPK